MGLECVLYGDERLQRSLQSRGRPCAAVWHCYCSLWRLGRGSSGPGFLVRDGAFPLYRMLEFMFQQPDVGDLWSHLSTTPASHSPVPMFIILLSARFISFHYDLLIPSTRNIHICKKRKPISALIHEMVEETRTGVNMPSDYPSLVVCWRLFGIPKCFHIVFQSSY